MQFTHPPKTRLKTALYSNLGKKWVCGGQKFLVSGVAGLAGGEGEVYCVLEGHQEIIIPAHFFLEDLDPEVRHLGQRTTSERKKHHFAETWELLLETVSVEEVHLRQKNKRAIHVFQQWNF